MGNAVRRWWVGLSPWLWYYGVLRENCLPFGADLNGRAGAPTCTKPGNRLASGAGSKIASSGSITLSLLLQDLNQHLKGTIRERHDNLRVIVVI